MVASDVLDAEPAYQVRFYFCLAKKSDLLFSWDLGVIGGVRA